MPINQLALIAISHRASQQLVTNPNYYYNTTWEYLAPLYLYAKQ